MPGLNGLDACRQVKNSTRGVSVPASENSGPMARANHLDPNSAEKREACKLHRSSGELRPLSVAFAIAMK